MSLLGIGLGLSITSSVFGQFGGFGTTGQTGGIGQTGLGQTGLGQTGLGQTGLGQTGLGQTGGMGQAGGLGQTGGINQLGSPNIANAFGSGGILGSNTNSAFGGLANTALLGRSLGGGAGGMGGMNGMNGMGGMGGMGGGRGGAQGGRGGFNSMNQNQKGNKPQVRATVKLGFDVKPPTNAAGSQVINSRLSRIPSSLLKGIIVEMNGRTAVMRGNVATLAEAKVVERYLSLEPGISDVQNELVIASGEKVTPKAGAKKTPTANSSRSALESTTAAQTNNDSSPNSAVQAASPEIVPAPGP